jgi:pimeloyl-ACP methyl ester carboxylesterase
MKKLGIAIVIFLVIALGVFFGNKVSVIEIPSDIIKNSVYVDSGRIHYIDSGSGIPLIFIHGFGASMYCWRKNIGPVSEHFRTVALDLPGFGYSEKSLNSDYSLDEYTDVIIEFMDKMQIRDAILVGHSLGGGIALMVTLKYPERVRGLILIDTEAYAISPPFMLKVAKLPVLNSFIHHAIGEWVIRISLDRSYYNSSLITDKLVREYYNPFLTENGKAAPIKLLQAMDFTKLGEVALKYKEIRKKSLIIWGANDKISGLHLAHKLRNDLINSQLLIVPQSGHLVQEEQPDIVNRAIINFIKRGFESNGSQTK